ncbi:2259_t:CDS:10 [Dentiscutata heterogama]|uniref:2259_t:CDS:1 n=1 Tax=Dentiscutata heterogama TaxID=1316150 RepID=A0ACA9KTB3_9GLOM|nr:2259_t:CDS:10 [Dentiscutata heterogama]
MENSVQEKMDSSSSTIEFKVPAPVNTKPPESIPPVPYEKPDWSDISKIDYGFEVIKGGLSVETIDLSSKEFLVLGRLPVCDLSMEHPSISRYHAIIQFNNKGDIFIYDLDSAHGTRVNKQRISSRNYIRLRVGDQIKFGESTRTYVLLGPEEEQTQQTIKPPPKPTLETTGVTWGFAEDADDEGEPLVAVAKESWKRDENAYYYKDPKKALRNWLENRGYDMEFESEQEGPGHARTFTSRIQLPDVEDAYGPVYGIGTGSKKRDADRQAAIDACEKLDMLGLLRGGQEEAGKKRLQHLLDVEDDDDDSFYDRTGQKDRLKSKKPQMQKVETYESLIKQREELMINIEEIRNKIHKAAESETSKTITLTDDDLDSYMDIIRNEIKDESTANLETKLQDLLKQEQRLARLIEITKPPDIMQHDNSSSAVKNLQPINDEQELSNVKENLESVQTKSIEISPIIDSEIQEPTVSPQLIESTDPEKSDEGVTSMIPKKREISQEDLAIDSEKGKKIKALIPMTPHEYEEQQRKAQELNELEIEDVTIWEPPQGQTGDGRTSLNDKYGY